MQLIQPLYRVVVESRRFHRIRAGKNSKQMTKKDKQLTFLLFSEGNPPLFRLNLNKNTKLTEKSHRTRYNIKKIPKNARTNNPILSLFVESRKSQLLSHPKYHCSSFLSLSQISAKITQHYLLLSSTTLSNLFIKAFLPKTYSHISSGFSDILSLIIRTKVLKQIK